LINKITSNILYPTQNIALTFNQTGDKTMSDTFFISDKETFNQLAPTDKWEIVQELVQAIIDDQWVSIRGEMIEEMDRDFYPVLYGVYRLKFGEVCNYRDAGGIWDYEKPVFLLNTFTANLAEIEELSKAINK
jgi:hypothetical protein